MQHHLYDQVQQLTASQLTYFYLTPGLASLVMVPFWGVVSDCFGRRLVMINVSAAGATRGEFTSVTR